MSLMSGDTGPALTNVVFFSSSWVSLLCVLAFMMSPSQLRKMISSSKRDTGMLRELQTLFWFFVSMGLRNVFSSDVESQSLNQETMKVDRISGEMSSLCRISLRKHWQMWKTPFFRSQSTCSWFFHMWEKGGVITCLWSSTHFLILLPLILFSLLKKRHVLTIEVTVRLSPHDKQTWMHSPIHNSTLVALATAAKWICCHVVLKVWIIYVATWHHLHIIEKHRPLLETGSHVRS